MAESNLDDLSSMLEYDALRNFANALGFYANIMVYSTLRRASSASTRRNSSAPIACRSNTSRAPRFPKCGLSFSIKHSANGNT